MDPLIGASLISTAGSLAGGFIGKPKGMSASRAFAYQQGAERNTIPNLVYGAKKAGIHPLAALGVSPSSGPLFSIRGANTSMANAVSRSGQDIARAVSAGKTPYDKAVMTLDVERRRKENELLDVQIQRTKQEINSTHTIGDHPDIPVAGQAPGHFSNEHSYIQPVAPEVSIHSSPGTEAGVNPASRWSMRDNGKMVEFPGTKNQEAIESAWLNQVEDVIHRGAGSIVRQFDYQAIYAKAKSLPRPRKGMKYIYKPLRGFYMVPYGYKTRDPRLDLSKIRHKYDKMFKRH